MVTIASDNPFPSILMVEGDPEALAANPASGQRRLAVDSSDHLLYLVDDTGTKTLVGTSASVATDAIWDAAGDLAVGSGSNTAAKLTKGSDGTVLRMASGAVGWANAPITSGTATTATNETLTGNNSFVDLATAGPAVTIVVNTKVLVTVSAEVSWTGSSAASRYAAMGYALSSGNTVAATRATSFIVVGENNSTTGGGGGSRTSLLTGLTPGSTVFTAKYNQLGSGATANWQHREICVICLD